MLLLKINITSKKVIKRYIIKVISKVKFNPNPDQNSNHHHIAFIRL